MERRGTAEHDAVNARHGLVADIQLARAFGFIRRDVERLIVVEGDAGNGRLVVDDGERLDGDGPLEVGPEPGDLEIQGGFVALLDDQCRFLRRDAERGFFAHGDYELPIEAAKCRHILAGLHAPSDGG